MNAPTDPQRAEFLRVVQTLVGEENGASLFLKRLMSLEVDTWTDDMTHEAARIVADRRPEVIRLINFDPFDLDIVRGSAWWPANHAVRSEVRALTKPSMVEVLNRRCDIAAGSLLQISWDRSDPQSNELTTDAQRLPGRILSIDGARQVRLTAPITHEAGQFVKAWEFLVTNAAKAVLKEKVRPPYRVRLGEIGRVVIDSGGLVAPWLDLPGFSAKDSTADLCPELLLICRQLGLSVDPAVEEAITTSGGSQRRAEALAVASRCGHPEDLPESFLALLCHDQAPHYPEIRVGGNRDVTDG